MRQNEEDIIERRIFTILKDQKNQIREIMCEEDRFMKLTKFEKEIHVDPNQMDNVYEKKKNEFIEEIQNDKNIIPSLPQVLPLIEYDILLNKEESKIKYIIYYNETNLIPLAQYFYINKDSYSAIINCLYKIGTLFKELSERTILKLSLQNIYVNGKDEIVLILPPFSFFNDENNFDFNDFNLSIIIPPESQESIVSEKYYSFLFGICMLRVLENNLFKKAIKFLFKNNYQLQMNNTSDLLQLYAKSSRKHLFSDKLKSLIKNCLQFDFNSRISVSDARSEIATINKIKIEFATNSKYNFNFIDCCNFTSSVTNKNS